MIEDIASISSDNLVEKLIGSEYSFAAWRLPQKGGKKMIVCLDKISQTSNPLEELSCGFLMNAFDEHHPPGPFHIKADLIFSENEPKISPTISSALIDQFFVRIKKNPVHSHENSTLPPERKEHPTFKNMVSKAIEKIRLGEFEKVVLSRFEDTELPKGFSATNFFDRICDEYPNAFCSLVHIPGKGLWIGASPELLISQDSKEFRTISLAGTKKLQKGDQLSEIAWTQKEIEEQALVSRYIINRFKEIRLREFIEHGPKTIKAGNLAHLKTEYVVHLNEVQIDSLASQMLNLLHPTSAVCGMPLEATKKFISKNEGYDREFYSGFLGPVNFNGETQLFVNLRCMKLEKNHARLFSGAGITEDSIPENELLETEMKMDILSRLVKFKEN